MTPEEIARVASKIGMTSDEFVAQAKAHDIDLSQFSPSDFAECATIT